MVDEYTLKQMDFLGLDAVLVYRCNRCDFRWLPKNLDGYMMEDILNRKPPKSCAACKSKYWRSERVRKRKKYDLIGASVARIRRLIRTNKLSYTGVAAYLLNHCDQEGYQRIMEAVQQELPTEKFEIFKGIVSKKYASKELELETFLPPS